MYNPEQVGLGVSLDETFEGLGLPERIAAIRSRFTGDLVFTTSFGLEDQAITHAIAISGVDVRLATLDTGRLFPETYDLWAETEARYGLRIAAFTPDATNLHALVARIGINGFRDAVENRKACCGVRKLEPLARALAGASVWITGLRAEQSAFRATTTFVSRDEAGGPTKVAPIADWARADLDRYVRDNAVPYNPLHDRGFPSIGCAPCTRAVRIGEPERAGRWWWENEDKKECGLHGRPGFGAPAERNASVVEG
jgi:phosphoadenosine phosphosulfate reductase